MARAFRGGTLVVASHNAGKVREIGDLLAPLNVTTLAAADLGLAEPAETGASFTANAELKAHAAAHASGHAALADDSGLVVPALGGAPGLHSARWAGPKRDFAGAMSRVARELERGGAAVEGCPARFVAALSFAWPDGDCETFEGRVEGRLVWPPRGERGFGYDPMFAADGHRLTFGELEPAEKHRISHRADAFRKLIDACFQA